MVFAVRLEMILELQNTLAQDCYLHFWRTGVGLVDPICCNCLLFCIRRQSHARIDTPRLVLIFFVLHRIAQIARGDLDQLYRHLELRYLASDGPVTGLPFGLSPLYSRFHHDN